MTSSEPEAPQPSADNVALALRRVLDKFGYPKPAPSIASCTNHITIPVLCICLCHRSTLQPTSLLVRVMAARMITTMKTTVA